MTRAEEPDACDAACAGGADAPFERADAAGERTKRAYLTPLLTRYGKLSEITAGRHGASLDGLGTLNKQP